MDGPDRSGVFDLKPELFKADGSRVNLTASGIDVQVQELTTLMPDGSYNWELAAAVNRYVEGGQLYGFQMTVAVDNNRCYAGILDAQVGATLAVLAENPAAGGASYSRAGITFGRTAPVGQILGPCLSAAFAEENYCYSSATDGWHSRAWWLDYYAPAKAFALTPV